MFACECMCVKCVNCIKIMSLSTIAFLLPLIYEHTSLNTQLSHKLFIRCMGALKSGVQSGNAEHKATGDGEGMVKALVELASFCDEQLRLKEDEGNAVLFVYVHCYMTCVCVSTCT